jgi:acyl-CoA synthetase (AMP-forming)/AMP-acid ligase II
LLQYSSGATGSPKGVMLAHRNVLANLAGLDRLIGLREDDSFGSWMPLHHDFGLYVQLTLPLIHGAHAVLMSPTDFVRRPVEWLRMMDRYGTTASSAPDFAYDMCVRVIPDEQLDGLDLSRLRFLANGSEPIHPPTMAAFGKRFARIGLQPSAFTAGYGMAEVTVYASGTPTPQEPTVVVADRRRLEDGEHPALVATRGPGKELVGVGRPLALGTRIVDPRTREPLPDGDIGEIWLSGDSVGLGYWGRPELSEETFRARLTGDHDPGRTWLRTGDLGALVDGDLFVTGRLKEILIIRGRNLFPQDVEHEARAAHPALEGVVGAAFGVEAPEERLVLVHEVSPRLPAEELPDVANALIQELTVAFGVPVRNVVLVRRGTVKRTTSGKIQRGAVRQDFLAGELTVLHAALEAEVRRLTAVRDR